MTKTDRETVEALAQGVADDLLPCPFCGDAASLREDGEHSTAFVLEHFSKGCPVDDLWDWYPDKQQAVAAWNRRAIPIAEGRSSNPRKTQ